MGGSPKPPKPSDEQIKNEKLSAELMKIQLEQARNPIKLPEIKPPKPMPAPPPPAQESSTEVAQKMEDERRKAYRRTNTRRNTIFAGETGAGLGGGRTILG
jgi:hypothetical protein